MMIAGCLPDMGISSIPLDRTPETGVSVGGSVSPTAAPGGPQLPRAAILSTGYDAAWPGKEFTIEWVQQAGVTPAAAFDAVVDEWDAFTASFNLDDTLPQDENGDIVDLKPVDKDEVPVIQALPAANGKKIVLQRYWPANLPNTTSSEFSDKWNNGDSQIGLEARKAAFKKVKDAIEDMRGDPNWAALNSEEKLKSLKEKMKDFIESHGDYEPGGFQSEGAEDEGGQALPTTSARNFLFEFYFGYVPKDGDKGLGKNTLNDLVFGPRKE
jgi:hypothetical protein